jgi:hypothetical protein
MPFWRGVSSFAAGNQSIHVRLCDKSHGFKSGVRLNVSVNCRPGAMPVYRTSRLLITKSCRNVAGAKQRRTIFVGTGADGRAVELKWNDVHATTSARVIGLRPGGRLLGAFDPPGR